MFQPTRLILSLAILLDLGATLALAVPPVPDDGFVLAMAAAGPSPGGKKPFENPAFGGTRLINLPTTTGMDKGDFLFRISHRFVPPVDSGIAELFGVDGPGVIFFSFGYGITDRLGVTLGRSNLFKEMELSLSWVLAEQGKTASLPFSAVLHTGMSWVTERQVDRGLFDGKNFKLNVQLSLSHQLSERISLMAVPAFSTNTNHWEENSTRTLALGLGGRYMFLKNLSIYAEWIPVLSGYRSTQNGWGLGLEKKIGGHVFQFFLTNGFALTSDQYLPGGDLRINDFDFRVGFNIFRTF